MHIYALVNHALAVFKDGWNNHGIRTVNNLSSNQLFVADVLQVQSMKFDGFRFFG